MSATHPFEDPVVEAVFNACPAAIQKRMLALRAMVFEVAASTAGVGELQESLKWGEPAYLTARSKSGSTIRMAPKKDSNTQYALYFNCQTTLVDTFRTLFPTEFSYEGNRGIVFDTSSKVPAQALKFCIAMALTYHRSKAGPTHERR